MLAADHKEGFNFEKAKFPLPGYVLDCLQVANAAPIRTYFGATLSLDITSRRPLPARGSPRIYWQDNAPIWLPVKLGLAPSHGIWCDEARGLSA